MALRGTGFGVILAIVGRTSQPEKRSLALDIATVAGSAGQVFGAPAAQLLLQHYPRQTVFGIFAIVILLTLMALPFLKATRMASKAELHETLRHRLDPRHQRPFFLDDLLGVLFLRKSAWFHHGALPCVRDRAV